MSKPSLFLTLCVILGLMNPTPSHADDNMTLQQSPPDTDKAVGQSAFMLNEGMRIDADQIGNVESSALDGDAEAAHRLARYYNGIKLDHTTALYWYQIAAENGGAVNHYNYGYMLTVSNNPKDKKRARYWFNLALKEGEESAADAIKQLDDPNYGRNKIRELIEQKKKQHASEK